MSDAKLFQETCPETLSLSRIASWYSGTTIPEDARREIETKVTALNGVIKKAGVPILQRGLVWRPQQIEMLWDSILRGFPIGSIVLCKKIENQTKSSDDNSTHHILDGQQRCNAISLGFIDPFTRLSDEESKSVSNILWLDLAPEFQNGSTREFLARMTTKAHPWGYWNNDEANRISAGDIRKAWNAITAKPEKRPSPVEMWPAFSRAPIPMAWLMNADLSKIEGFRESILKRLAEHKSTLKWAETTTSALNVLNAQRLEKIYKGIKRAREHTRIVALMAPDGLLDSTDRESNEENPNAENISNIEQLFQRLNQQGTRLDGEELSYSMIKAYWPTLAAPVDKHEPKHMPASRIVSLGVRVALSDDDKEHLHGALNVSQIRGLANKKDERITRFIIGNGICDGPLFRANKQVDTWLRYSKEKNPSGFIPLQITRFAMESPDVYALLIWIAVQTEKDQQIQSNLKQSIQAMTSWIHWFSLDKGKAVNHVYSSLRKNGACDKETIAEAIQSSFSSEEQFLVKLPTPQNLLEFLQLPDDSGLKDWDWWKLGRDDKGQDDENRKRTLEQIVYRIIGNKELLTYAQRDYLTRSFGDYNPAEKDEWQDYNCPWDYDHILPHYYTYYQQGHYQKFASKFVNSIGNFRAVEASKNKSDQKDLVKDKIKDNEYEPSFLERGESLAFSVGHDVKHKPEVARLFAEACWARNVRIYANWYSSVGIADLLPPEEKSVPSQPPATHSDAVA
jgi:hypothetical protein